MPHCMVSCLKTFSFFSTLTVILNPLPIMKSVFIYFRRIFYYMLTTYGDAMCKECDVEQGRCG